MVHALDDPYSVYLDKEDFTKLSEMTEGSFGGIGIVFGKRGDDYVVISALADHPGALAGIKSGDIILAVDGNS
jgi:carboxyl-terminal processing protease